MDDSSNSSGDTGSLRPVPDLPQSLVGLWGPAIVGTAAWFIALAVLLIIDAGSLWVWTALTGGVLGFIGFGIIAWQSAASRNGSRGAQRSL